MPRALTRPQLQEILEVWQQRLELDRWRIEVAFDEPSESTSAEIWRASDYDSARLRLNKAWPDWSRQEANETIVHELLHLATRDLEQAWALLEDTSGRDAWAVAEGALSHALEGHVDHLARRLVELAGVV